MTIHQPIKTKFHRVVEAMRRPGNTLGYDDHALIKRMAAMPKYLGNRLPHPKLVVEVPVAQGHGALFVVLEEHARAMGHDDTYGKPIVSDFRAAIVSLALDTAPNDFGSDGGDIVAFMQGHFLVRAGTPERAHLLTGYKPDYPRNPGSVARIKEMLVVVVKMAIKTLLLAMTTDGSRIHHHPYQRRATVRASALDPARFRHSIRKTASQGAPLT